jgi:protein TonB
VKLTDSIFFMLLLTNYLKAQEKEIATDSTENRPLFITVEEQAHPSDGMTEFYKRVALLHQYPSQARIKKIEGRVFVEFIVNENGSLSDFKILRGIGYGCNEAAIEAITNAGNWVPGKQRGKFVRQSFIVPIIFKQGNSGSNRRRKR